jgi:hypothetical protein
LGKVEEAKRCLQIEFSEQNENVEYVNQGEFRAKEHEKQKNKTKTKRNTITNLWVNKGDGWV